MLIRVTYQDKMLRTGMKWKGLVVLAPEITGHLIWIETGDSACYADQSNYCWTDSHDNRREEV
jgi:hypothetical protein